MIILERTGNQMHYSVIEIEKMKILKGLFFVHYVCLYFVAICYCWVYSFMSSFEPESLKLASVFSLDFHKSRRLIQYLNWPKYETFMEIRIV